MSSFNDNILRDGTSQKGRYAEALNPENVLVDGRDVRYYLRYVEKLAKILRFYNRANIPYATWSPYFPEAADIEKLLATTDTAPNHSPQLALFLAFTRLMEILKTDINQLSKQHLNFYYRDVLRFQPQKAVPEKANVVFEISPAVLEPFILEDGAELFAGNDASGNPIIFTTDREMTLSNVAVSKLSAVLVDRGNQSRVYAAPKADSLDGVQIPLPKDAPYWNPFGESQIGKVGDERTMVDGKIGFAIGSPMLLLHEGTRKITIHVRCQNFRFIDIHFADMLTKGVLPIVVDQLRPIDGILYESEESIEKAILDHIGAANVATYGTIIRSNITHPLQVMTDSELEKAFVAALTGEAGWFPVAQVTTVKQFDTHLRFEIELDDEHPAVIDFDPIIHQESIYALTPIVQLVLNHDAPKYLYDQLRGLRMVDFQIDVEVKGIRKMILHTDNGPANSTQPFLPFGAFPTTGSSLYFGSREIFSKSLTKLELELSWANLPADPDGFEDYYDGYYLVDPTNEAFKATFSVLEKKKWKGASPVELFKTNLTPPVPGTHPLVTDVYVIDLPLPAVEYQPLPEISNFDPSLPGGFGRLLLQPLDFGHTIFPKIYADKAITKVSLPATPLPNPPYTPKINHFAVNYLASSMSFPSVTLSSGSEKLFHVQPFGLVPVNGPTALTLLPQFPEGSLFIGLENLTPPQNVSILFQMVDGSANPDVEVDRDDVQWSYFNGTGWKQITEASIPMDTTFGLQTSGIIELSIGRDAVNDAPLWTNGLHWIAATFSKNPSGSSKVASILPNATVATIRQDLVLETLDLPFPPESINKILFSNALIKSVKQPFSSFSGKRTESEKDFYRRVSERLRHKNRGVNLWDYEHLVLEAFPSIYKVKCLPHTGPAFEADPGAVTLLVIPDLRKRNKINPFEPKVSAILRSQVKEYLTRQVSGFTTIYVDNPNYEQIRVEMSVGLRPGYDGSFYGRLLNEELKRFLSPWAFEEGKDVVFGGKIFKSSILSFVEQREYVDYVTNFKLYHIQGGLGIGDMRIWDLADTPQDFIVRSNTDGEEEESEVAAFSPRSILVTAPEHQITVLNPGEFICPDTLGETGIGAMIIEVDFFVF